MKNSDTFRKNRHLEQYAILQNVEVQLQLQQRLSAIS